MTLRVERAALVAALSQVARVVENRNTIPILANVYLASADGRLTVRGTDLDIEITTSVAADGDLPATTAPAKTLLDIVKKFPAGAEVTLELDGETLIVKSGRSRFKLAVLDADSFPTIADETYAASFSTDLAGLVAPVTFAQSSEETRFYLCGVFLHNPGSALVAVATDGHRLAKVTADSVGDLPPSIIPTKTVALIPQGVVSVSLSERKVRFVQGDTTIVSKLIQGTFPDYERVIPKNNDRVLVVSRADLLAAVERVATIANDRSGKAVKLELASDSVTLSVRGDNDSATEELPAEYGSEPLTIGFNAGYLSEQLRNVTGEKVRFELQDGGPALIRGDNDNWVSVLMPMRVA